MRFRDSSEMSLENLYYLPYLSDQSYLILFISINNI